METNDRDIMRKLFAELPEEQLPAGLNEKIMHQVHKNISAEEKHERILAACGYIFGAVSMIAACVLVFYKTDFSFDMPDVSFRKPDLQFLKSPSFLFSIYIGVLVMMLLLIDNAVCRHINKRKGV